MSSPFEELEYLSDYLPEEGEAVIVSRRGGELICEALPAESNRDLLADSEFYGRMVFANERLVSQGAFPIWTCVLGCFWICVGLHLTFGLGWNGWYFDAGVALSLLLVCFLWIRRRQTTLFYREIRPMLSVQLRRRMADRYSVIGSMRQHPELRTLLDVLSRTGE